MCSRSKFSLANLSLLLFLRIFRSFVLWFLKELSRNVFHCSVIKDHFYLAVSQTALIFYHVAFDLSRTFFAFFKSLWKLFVPDPVVYCLSQTQLWNNIICFPICQELFSSFLIFSTLPVFRDLVDPGCSSTTFDDSFVRIPRCFFFVNTYFSLYRWKINR